MSEGPSHSHSSPPVSPGGAPAAATAKRSWLGARGARRIAVLVAGTTVVLVGVALLVLPGPGLVTILVGLGILSVEFAFAKRWIGYIQAHSERVANKAGVPQKWRWAFPAMAIAISAIALALPLFVAVVRTPSGVRVVHKPSISYLYTLTSSESLRKRAAQGDAFAAALLEHAEPSPQVPTP